MFDDLILSTNFKLSEFIYSEEAFGRDIDNMPSDSAIENLHFLCNHVLEPIRSYFNSPLVVSSGYRCQKLNDLVSKIPTSHHRCLDRFAAADFTIPEISLARVFDVIRHTPLPYHHVIKEHDQWIHLSAQKPLRQEMIIK